MGQLVYFKQQGTFRVRVLGRFCEGEKQIPVMQDDRPLLLQLFGKAHHTVLDRMGVFLPWAQELLKQLLQRNPLCFSLL